MKNQKIVNGGKNAQKECQIQDCPNKSGNISLQDTGVWEERGGHGWRIFEGKTGSTLPTPVSYTHLDVYKRQL